MATNRFKVMSKGECFANVDTAEKARDVISSMKNSKTNGKTNACALLEYAIVPYQDDGKAPTIDLKYKPG
jgi:hypothetical protein